LDSNKHILSIIWDYDGTLADTRHKNLNVTTRIVEQITGVNPIQYPALQSLSNYSLAISHMRNWRDLYRREFKLTEEQTDQAGNLWTEYQFADKTPVTVYEGIPEVLKALSSLPHGIVSQNSHQIINGHLTDNGLVGHFRSVIGYEEVDFANQKPQPDGLIKCIEELTGLKSGYVFYIGDHETDALCAANANKAFKDEKIEIEIISVGAFYGYSKDDVNWTVRPQLKARRAKDIMEIITSSKWLSQNHP
jgi:HAD superfamily hydrolase (TIGR01549 family)